MAPHCEVGREWQTTRKDLARFARAPNNIDSARKNTPFHRTVSPDQVDLIDSLRRNYARHATDCEPNKQIRVQRHIVRNFDLKSTNAIKSPTFVSGIYSSNSGVVVDFANKQLGGGFLTYGMAQEEVMFLERFDIGMYVAMMYVNKQPFTIADNEALVIYGADKWASLDFYGKVPRDWDEKSMFCRSGRPEKLDAIIAIDCLKATFKKYGRGDLQWILKKAYVGFQSVSCDTVSTGNWGCGAFANNKHVIMCIQVLAASLANKKLCFYSMEEEYDVALNLIAKWERAGISIKNAFEELVQLCANDERFLSRWDPSRRSTGHFEERSPGGGRISQTSPRRKTVQKGEGVSPRQSGHGFKRRTRGADSVSDLSGDNAVRRDSRSEDAVSDRRNSASDAPAPRWTVPDCDAPTPRWTIPDCDNDDKDLAVRAALAARVPTQFDRTPSRDSDDTNVSLQADCDVVVASPKKRKKSGFCCFFSPTVDLESFVSPVEPEPVEPEPVEPEPVEPRKHWTIGDGVWLPKDADAGQEETHEEPRESQQEEERAPRDHMPRKSEHEDERVSRKSQYGDDHLPRESQQGAEEAARQSKHMEEQAQRKSQHEEPRKSQQGEEQAARQSKHKDERVPRRRQRGDERSPRTRKLEEQAPRKSQHGDDRLARKSKHKDELGGERAPRTSKLEEQAPRKSQYEEPRKSQKGEEHAARQSKQKNERVPRRSHRGDERAPRTSKLGEHTSRTSQLEEHAPRKSQHEEPRKSQQGEEQAARLSKQKDEHVPRTSKLEERKSQPGDDRVPRKSQQGDKQAVRLSKHKDEHTPRTSTLEEQAPRKSTRGAAEESAGR